MAHERNIGCCTKKEALKLRKEIRDDIKAGESSYRHVEMIKFSRIDKSSQKTYPKGTKYVVSAWG